MEHVRVYITDGRIYVEWVTGKYVISKIDWSITEWEAAKAHMADKVKELVDAEALRRVSDLHGGNGPKVST